MDPIIFLCIRNVLVWDTLLSPKKALMHGKKILVKKKKS